MNRLRRPLIILGVSLVVTLVAMIVRWLNAGGVFTEVKPGFAGSCTAIASAASPGDIAIDSEDRLGFVAVTDRRALDEGRTSKNDGIYAFSLASPEAGLTKLSGAPANFHPRSISLYRAKNGAVTLMAIAGNSEDPAIDIFDVGMNNGAASLKQRTAITSGLLVRPEGIAAVGPDRFYVTNSGTSDSVLGRFFETYALMPRANVLYFDGTLFRVAAEDLSDAQGVLVSPDGAHLYVASRNGRTLYSFARGALSGQLTQEGNLSIDAGLKGIRSDTKGGLLVAGTPRPFDEERYRGNPSNTRAPSQVFAVALRNGIPDTAEQLYANRGEEISDAGSAAAAANGHVFIGSTLDRKILDCTPEGTPD